MFLPKTRTSSTERVFCCRVSTHVLLRNMYACLYGIEPNRARNGSNRHLGHTQNDVKPNLKHLRSTLSQGECLWAVGSHGIMVDLLETSAPFNGTHESISFEYVFSCFFADSRGSYFNIQLASVTRTGRGPVHI